MSICICLACSISQSTLFNDLVHKWSIATYIENKKLVTCEKLRLTRSFISEVDHIF